MEWYLLFGHLFGDYLLQNSWMAYYKKVNFLPCFAHCIIYTMSVSVFLAICPEITTISISLMFWIFMSHWILDRYRLIDQWFRLLGVRSWDSFEGGLEDAAQIHQAVTISFGALVYTVADNTVHLFLMFILLQIYY